MPDDRTPQQRMADRHEFKGIEYSSGGQVRVQCWCGEPTKYWESEGSARSDHTRHQSRMLAPGRTVAGGMGR
jgi:hypothetical protein